MHAHFQAATVNFRSCSCPSVIEEIGHYTKEWVRYDAAQGGSVRVTWPMILGMAFPYLQNSGLSIEGQIMKIAERFFFNNHDSGSGADELFDFVEFCAGRANLSRELLRKSWKGCSLDIRFSPLHDMCSQWGCEHSLTAYLPPKTGRSIGLEQNAVHLVHFVKVWLRGILKTTFMETPIELVFVMATFKLKLLDFACSSQWCCHASRSWSNRLEVACLMCQC